MAEKNLRHNLEKRRQSCPLLHFEISDGCASKSKNVMTHLWRSYRPVTRKNKWAINKCALSIDIIRLLSFCHQAAKKVSHFIYLFIYLIAFREIQFRV